MEIVYLDYGNRVGYRMQTYFSILSLMAYTEKVPAIHVVTDHAVAYARLEKYVHVVEVGQETLKEWRGENDYSFRIKIKAVEHVAKLLKEQGKDKEPLMYIDCDTFAVCDLRPLFEGAAQGLAYMQKNEGMPYQTHGPSKRLWNDVKGKTYCGIEIDEHSEMWNSGLIVAPVSVMEKVCELTLRLCDEMLAQGIKSFNVEQFCFSMALRHECQQIHSAESFFCHYWGNKEGWNQVQTEFFVRSYMEQLTVEQEVQLFKALDFTSVPYYVKSPIWRDRFLRWTDHIAPLKGQRYLDNEELSR